MAILKAIFQILGWKGTMGIVLALVLAALGMAKAIDSRAYKRGFDDCKNSPADTSQQITQRQIEIPSDSGESDGVVSVDTSRFKSQIAAILKDAREKGSTISKLLTREDSLSRELSLRDAMIEKLAAEKSGREESETGKLWWSFNPMYSFPNGRLKYRWDFNPITVSDTSTTITKHLVEPQPFLSLYVRGQIVGDWSNSLWHKNIGGMEGGVRLRFGAVRLSFSPIGLGVVQNQTHPTRSISLEVSTE